MEDPANKGEESSKKAPAASSSPSGRRAKEVSVNAVNTAHQAPQQYSERRLKRMEETIRPCKRTMFVPTPAMATVAYSREYKLRLNPAKCTFGARSGKLLGFVVSERGIEVDPDKVKAIKELPPTSTVQEPSILVPPVSSRPLILYLTVRRQSLGCMLGQEDESTRTEKAIYYLSRKFTEGESNYPEIEKMCCALPLEIEIAERPAYCNAIETSEAKPWYEDIKNLLQTGQYLPFADRRDRKTLRRLAIHYFLSGEILYRRSFDSTLLRCIDEHESRRLMEEVHGGNCGPHMNGLMLAKKIMRLGYYWSTMETDCVKHCYQQRMARAFNTRVRHRDFKPGDLVLRKVLHVTPDSRGKFSYKYDGPFVVKDVFSGGAVILSDMDGAENALPVNADAIKKYYP
ncbi:hypothetical protein CRG98_003684 [Punica granatum]|uniref:Reverse transcriptase/retrotransposon-derived protein RNase H-like domain-containing protein n=1 Tax=Punica granatum TaxID=22663 RepID=A0A2I0L5N3_PUNGR|nr:hypothetical protein CRG98_003684 [Punica granatum]